MVAEWDGVGEGRGCIYVFIYSLIHLFIELFYLSLLFFDFFIFSLTFYFSS